jgi:radical SAM superfamily enzyme YgiQ (UPF0313 family)
MPRYIDPVRDLGASLLAVEKPARYVGGEYGRLAPKDAALRALIAFPDLYEIGMSNQALRILYNRLNRIPGVSCDRAFAPAPDFEKLLLEKKLPLYGLDTGLGLGDFDLILITLGYELGISGVLTMLDVSGIPIHNAKRDGGHPLVIAGGPAVSNPLPYASFIDAFWIGEAEAGFFDLARELLRLKRAGEGRAALLAKTAAHPHIWVRGKEKAARAIDANFSDGVSPSAVFPVPSMKTVQHHGAVEIMRGCPNGCRFCHAGFWYRPMRQKKAEQVIGEAAAFIREGGYRELSLSSLSSGDYSGVGELVDELNRRFGDRHISFQLPSLKVSGFSLSLLEKIAVTRRSGLTFAVETPVDAWQMAVNKTVTRDSAAAILREAKKRGWRGAKFYFMIGLPLPTIAAADTGPEETEIAAFIADLGRKTAMHFNINVGIFVPKPHTPYQRAAQIDSDSARAKLDYIRSRLKPLGHKVSVSDPLVSLIEGILSRGDERAGDLIEAAWQGGSRLDAWSEFINKDAWRHILEQNRELVKCFLSEKNSGMPLPWQGIESGVSSAFLQEELDRSNGTQCTLPCTENCKNPCGICDKHIGVIQNNTVFESIFVNRDEKEDNGAKKTGKGAFFTAESEKKSDDNGVLDFLVNQQKDKINDNQTKGTSDPAIWRVLFSFSKTGGAVFHGHLSIIEIFSMAFNRAALPVLYTRGFNPLAKMEIAAPLSTGISAEAEIAIADFPRHVPPETFREKLNANLPEGLRIEQVETYRVSGGCKKHSLSSLLWGFGYAGAGDELEYIAAPDEKRFRTQKLSGGASLFTLTRSAVLAKNIITGAPSWVSYFEAYRFLYPHK